jgi:hypothetical protein
VTTVALAGDLEPALQQIPVAPGVARLLGPEAKVLLVGRAASLRRWAQRQLGRGRAPKPGRRPPVDLSPIARSLVYETTASEFEQRLVYERWMAPLVPLARRRDLKPPVFLRLDPQERFPRLSVHVGRPSDPRLFYGPFRDRKGAELSIAALHKALPLRPCDFSFEPDPALPLGLGCVYAQVRTCAAPCLARIAEPDYRALAAAAAARLAGGAPGPPWLAPAGARAVVVERTPRGVELFPVLGGAVLDEERTLADSLEAGLPALRFRAPAAPRDDWPWLLAWLAAPRRKGEFLVLRDAGAC